MSEQEDIPLCSYHWQFQVDDNCVFSSDVPSPNKNRRMERKRTAPASERLEDLAEAPHSESKQRCTTDVSFTRQSTANNSGSGSYQSRNYHSNYRQNNRQHPQSYGRRDYYNNQYDRYDFSRQPCGYDRQGYNAYQNDYASDGSWRKPRGYDQHGYDFASNDFSNHTNFGGASFQRGGGRAHGLGWGQRDPRPQYGQSSRNDEAGRNYNDHHYQRSDSKQWRGNNQSDK